MNMARPYTDSIDGKVIHKEEGCQAGAVKGLGLKHFKI